MADNTKEEHLDSSTNIQAENPSNETTPAKDRQAIPLNQEDTNMEVHKHSHHVTHKKKWTEYLLEFFMLFLAVFLGFVAENIRENITEHHREKEYIKSLVQDLKTDTTKIAKNQKGYGEAIKGLETLAMELDKADSGFTPRLYTLFDWIMAGYPDFIYTDATIQQLKNSGGFRLIEKKDVIDSIMAYDAAVKRALINGEGLKERGQLMLQANNDLINYRAIDKQIKKVYVPGKKNINELTFEKFDFLLTHEPLAENRYYNKLITYQKTMRIVKNYNYRPLKEQAVRLITFLRKEYHLENE